MGIKMKLNEARIEIKKTDKGFIGGVVGTTRRGKVYSPAGWGVFKDGKQIASILKYGAGWNVYDLNSRPLAFLLKSRKEATEWAKNHKW